MRWMTLVLAGFLGGCVSLNSVSLTQVPKERKNIVTAEASKIIILGFTFSNEYIDEAHRQLMAKCQNGMIQGILTKDEMTNYFIGIVMKQKVFAKGYCIKGKGQDNA